MNHALEPSCDEWRDAAEDHPQEMEVIMEMMIEADAEICHEVESALH